MLCYEILHPGDLRILPQLLLKDLPARLPGISNNRQAKGISRISPLYQIPGSECRTRSSQQALFCLKGIVLFLLLPGESGTLHQSWIRVSPAVTVCFLVRYNSPEKSGNLSGEIFRSLFSLQAKRDKGLTELPFEDFLLCRNRAR